MITVPINKEFKLSALHNCIFRIYNGVLQGRHIDDFTWHTVTSFTIKDIEAERFGCLECCHG